MKSALPPVQIAHPLPHLLLCLQVAYYCISGRGAVYFRYSASSCLVRASADIIFMTVPGG
jgi:hypothetical protein